MLEDFSDASPVEFAAFFELNQFIIGDIEAVAKLLLKRGYDGEYIAKIAFDFVDQGMRIDECFKKALHDAGVNRIPSHEESTWLAVRYYLNKMMDYPDMTLINLARIVDLERDWGNVKLFDRPDCDAHFEAQRNKYKYAGSIFAGQGWGIEKLLGIYYSSDDWHFSKTILGPSYEDWRAQKIKEQIDAALKEAKKIIQTFYSPESDLPDSLCKVSDLL